MRARNLRVASSVQGEEAERHWHMPLTALLAAREPAGSNDPHQCSTARCPIVLGHRRKVVDQMIRKLSLICAVVAALLFPTVQVAGNSEP